MHTEIIPTMLYFDWNRNQEPIIAMKYVPDSKDCGAGYERLPKLYNWPGTRKGCKI